MKLKKFAIYLALLVLFSCSTSYNIQSSDSNITEVKASADSSVLAIIAPYQKAIEAEMNEILTYSKIRLTKKGTESLLGNFVAYFGSGCNPASIAIL